MKNRIIENIDNNTLFIFVIIIVFVIYFFSFFDIKLNIIFGFIIAGLIVYYMYNDNLVVQNRNNELLDEKKKLIIPQPLKAIDYNEMVDFLFTIQDFHQYNQNAYEQMMMNIDYFFENYQNIIDDPEIAYLKYEMLFEQKINALNNLQSITYSLNPNTQYDKKLQNAIKRLDELLNVYIRKAYKIYANELYKKNIDERIIKKINDPDAYNSFENNDLFHFYVVV
jgi:hypothetical protein